MTDHNLDRLDALEATLRNPFNGKLTLHEQLELIERVRRAEGALLTIQEGLSGGSRRMTRYQAASYAFDALHPREGARAALDPEQAP